MKDKEKTILKIISMSCFVILTIIHIADKNYVSGICFLIATISYSFTFLNQKKNKESK
ncbi:hypothetical protein [Clostridium perfringens]|uniref:hypothetical protein n=1 Tax=Clostridium perfringens TaxID=1502 RepID=UPI0022473CF0|nr:hypothetical protein [Clostridium perfringens]MCX0403448.1 hypothetical protein [Clostridium perfringens]